MIGKGFIYCVPPFMIRSNVVTGVMSFAEMENMMYKIEGEDLYLIGTSEHSMIGKLIDTTLKKEQLPADTDQLFRLLPQSRLARTALKRRGSVPGASVRKGGDDRHL